MEGYAMILEMTIIITSFCIFAYLFWRFHDPTSGLWTIANLVALVAFIVGFYYDQQSTSAMSKYARFIEWTAFFVSPFLSCWGIVKLGRETYR